MMMVANLVLWMAQNLVETWDCHWAGLMVICLVNQMADSTASMMAS